ncbi:Regulator of G-protein signaling 3 [Manis javanica]|nr:Regulator of G-protein signaling 3 [Manis javanica]
MKPCMMFTVLHVTPSLKLPQSESAALPSSPAGPAFLSVYSTSSLNILTVACAIFPGWIEWQGQDTSLLRKDAWTQTSPVGRKIGHTQIQGAGGNLRVQTRAGQSGPGAPASSNARCSRPPAPRQGLTGAGSG